MSCHCNTGVVFHTLTQCRALHSTKQVTKDFSLLLGRIEVMGLQKCNELKWYSFRFRKHCPVPNTKIYVYYLGKSMWTSDHHIHSWKYRVYLCQCNGRGVIHKCLGWICHTELTHMFLIQTENSVQSFLHDTTPLTGIDHDQLNYSVLHNIWTNKLYPILMAAGVRRWPLGWTFVALSVKHLSSN